MTPTVCVPLPNVAQALTMSNVGMCEAGDSPLNGHYFEESLSHPSQPTGDNVYPQLEQHHSDRADSAPMEEYQTTAKAKVDWR